MADHLIDGTHQLARINWEAVDRSKPGTRGSNIWMVEANVASLSKKVLTTQLNLLTTECFTAGTSEVSPMFTAKFRSDFQSKFGTDLYQAYEHGMLVPQDRACAIAHSTAKAIATKVTDAKSTQVEISDDLICSRVTFFRGHKYELYVLVGLSKTTQALGSATTALANALQEVMDICKGGTPAKSEAEGKLKDATAAWEAAIAAPSAQAEAYTTLNADGFAPLVPISQNFAPVTYTAPAPHIGSPVSNEPQHHEQEHFVTEPTGAPPGVQLGAVERNREKIAAHNKKMAASTIGAGKQGGAAGR